MALTGDAAREAQAEAQALHKQLASAEHLNADALGAELGSLRQVCPFVPCAACHCERWLVVPQGFAEWMQIPVSWIRKFARVCRPTLLVIKGPRSSPCAMTCNMPGTEQERVQCAVVL